MSGAINGMDIWADGTKFVTGGDDKVKINFTFVILLNLFLTNEQIDE